MRPEPSARTRVTNEWWPLFGLRIRTPRLELRPPDDADLAGIVELVEGGIHPPEEMPFSEPWTELDPPELQRSSLQYHWRLRAEWTAQNWHLPFGVWENGRLVGQQDLEARHFAVRRTVDTGSWVGMAHQGRGVGKEMRAAVLHLAFAGLGAERAETEAFVDNPASIAVTRSLGYEPNGDGIHDRKGRPATMVRYSLSRERWQARRRVDITVDGLEACRPMFGIEPVTAS